MRIFPGVLRTLKTITLQYCEPVGRIGETGNNYIEFWWGALFFKVLLKIRGSGSVTLRWAQGRQLVAMYGGCNCAEGGDEDQSINFNDVRSRVQKFPA